MVLQSVLTYLGSNPWIIGVLFLLYCFIYAISVLFSGPKPQKNPFSLNHVKPPKPLVTDHSLRNKVLKQRFKPQKVPEKVDVIVIGSGIGGLTTAVLLGRAGYKVLVLEQHDQAGGCCHTFVDKGFEFDTGVHYVGKMMEGDMTRILTDQITEGQVVWTPMSEAFDIVAMGPPEKCKFYPIVGGSRQKFQDNLEKLFPTEKVAISKYMKLLEDCRGSFLGVILPKMFPLWLSKFVVGTGLYQLVMRKFMKLVRMTTKEAFDEITDNEEMKNVLGYIFGDMGEPPSRLGIMGYATLMNHYIPGAFYPLGGTSEIAFQIIQIIERYGGRVLVDAPVSKIIVNDEGRATGVTVSRKGENIDIMAKKIISDAGLVNTFKYLLPPEIAQKTPLNNIIPKVGPSISYLTVFIGLDGTTEELKINAGNTWAFSGASVPLILDHPSYLTVFIGLDGTTEELKINAGNNTWAFSGENLDKELGSYTSLPVQEAANSECPLMFVSFPSAKDPSWEEKYPGKSVALIITLVPWEWFKEWENEKVKHRGEEYEGLKTQIAKQMWKQCQQMYPQLEGRMEYMDVGTPVSNKYYLGQPEGEMYGLNHCLDRFYPEISMYLRAESGIPGLYLTGQDILTCGFSGAMHAGMVTASAMLNRNLFNDLTKLTKEWRAASKDKKDQ